MRGEHFFQNPKLMSHCFLSPVAAGKKSDVFPAPGPLYVTRCYLAGSFWNV